MQAVCNCLCVGTLHSQVAILSRWPFLPVHCLDILWKSFCSNGSVHLLSKVLAAQSLFFMKGPSFHVFASAPLARMEIRVHALPLLSACLCVQVLHCFLPSICPKAFITAPHPPQPRPVLCHWCRVQLYTSNAVLLEYLAHPPLVVLLCRETPLSPSCHC